jgi:hypothetical protein
MLGELSTRKDISMGIREVIEVAVVESLKLCENVKDSPNEETTCFRVIVPLLRACGYDLTNISCQSSNDAGKRPDYIVMPENDEDHSFVVEAKAWGETLEEKHAVQATGYVNALGKRWAVLTNGQRWNLYDNKISGRPPAKLAATMQLENSSDAVDFLVAIGKDSVLAGKLGHYVEERRKQIEEVEKKLQETEKRRLTIRAIIENGRNDSPWRELLEKECVEPANPLVAQFVALAAGTEELIGLTPAEIVEVLRDVVVKPSSEGWPAEIQEVLNAYKTMGWVDVSRPFVTKVAPLKKWMKNGFHYEIAFDKEEGTDKKGGFFLSIHLENAKVKPLGDLLHSLQPEVERDLSVRVDWNPKWFKCGSLQIRYPNDEDPKTVARTFKGLIDMTVSRIREAMGKLP